MARRSSGRVQRKGGTFPFFFSSARLFRPQRFFPPAYPCALAPHCSPRLRGNGERHSERGPEANESPPLFPGSSRRFRELAGLAVLPAVPVSGWAGSAAAYLVPRGTFHLARWENAGRAEARDPARLSGEERPTVLSEWVRHAVLLSALTGACDLICVTLIVRKVTFSGYWCDTSSETGASPVPRLWRVSVETINKT